jgi:hypothetical protein
MKFGRVGRCTGGRGLRFAAQLDRDVLVATAGACRHQATRRVWGARQRVGVQAINFLRGHALAPCMRTRQQLFESVARFRYCHHFGCNKIYSSLRKRKLLDRRVATPPSITASTNPRIRCRAGRCIYTTTRLVANETTTRPA